MDVTTNIHGAIGVKLKVHWLGDEHEWATFQISGENDISYFDFTVFTREAIDDALKLPRSDDFRTNIPADEAA